MGWYFFIWGTPIRPILLLSVVHEEPDPKINDFLWENQQCVGGNAGGNEVLFCLVSYFALLRHQRPYFWRFWFPWTQRPLFWESSRNEQQSQTLQTGWWVDVAESKSLRILIVAHDADACLPPCHSEILLHLDPISKIAPPTSRYCRDGMSKRCDAGFRYLRLVAFANQHSRRSFPCGCRSRRACHPQWTIAIVEIVERVGVSI